MNWNSIEIDNVVKYYTLGLWVRNRISTQSRFIPFCWKSIMHQKLFRFSLFFVLNVGFIALVSTLCTKLIYSMNRILYIYMQSEIDWRIQHYSSYNKLTKQTADVQRHTRKSGIKKQKKSNTMWQLNEHLVFAVVRILACSVFFHSFALSRFIHLQCWRPKRQCIFWMHNVHFSSVPYIQFIYCVGSTWLFSLQLVCWLCVVGKKHLHTIVTGMVFMYFGLLFK